jgi:ADP-heptose:LPS heptosyltransferase
MHRGTLKTGLSKYRIKKIRRITRRILIIYLDFFGDFLTTTPFLEALRRHFPRSSITYILGLGAKSSKGTSRLIEENPNVDQCISSKVSILSDLLKVRPFDLAVNLCGGKTSQLIAKVSGARVKLWGRLAGVPTHFFYCDSLKGEWSPPLKINFKQGVYKAETFLDLVRFLGFKSKKVMVPKIYFSKEERRFSLNYLRNFKNEDKEIIIAIHPGGRDPERLWKTVNFSLLADSLIEKYNVKILVFYAPGEKHFALRVCRSSRYKLSMVHEKDIRKYASIISGCDVLISTDGGPLQIALACDTLCVGIFKSEHQKNIVHWYNYKKRKNLFSLFIKPIENSQRNVDDQNIDQRDRGQVNRVLKKVEEALCFKKNERNPV